METQDVLVVGSILLSCGCLGLLIAHMSSPVLKGLGWLACSFIAGTLGVASILAVHAETPGFSFIIANTLILLAYVSLQVSVCEITGGSSKVPRLGLILLGTQAALYPIFQWVHHAEQFSLITLGLTLAVQSLQTAAHLKKHCKKGMAAAVWLSICLLVSFAGFNILRSIVLAVRGVGVGPQGANPLELAAGIIFLAIALGLGFSIFWMTSMQLRLDLELLASTDSLTGLYNRRFFLLSCQQELMRSARAEEPVSLVMLDLDHFKQINDIHGHEGGDAALRAVASQLRSAVREYDILGRWGGEEFIVLLPGACADQAMQIAQRMRRSVEALSLSLEAAGRIGSLGEIPLAISAGVATASSPLESIDSLLRSCDEALYSAKAAGRNTVIQRDVLPGTTTRFPPVMAQPSTGPQFSALR
jgi:diguanylate cyclase (GGDEF)-like protein